MQFSVGRERSRASLGYEHSKREPGAGAARPRYRGHREGCRNLAGREGPLPSGAKGHGSASVTWRAADGERLRARDPLTNTVFLRLVNVHNVSTLCWPPCQAQEVKTRPSPSQHLRLSYNNFPRPL